MVMTLENTAWDFRASPPDMALVPLACLEPHGPHLPIGTDSLIVSTIARLVSPRLRGRIYLLPVWPLGISAHHWGEPGAVSLEHETLWAVVRDIAESLVAHGIRKVAVLNNHGSPMGTTTVPIGNSIVKTAVRQLNYETPGLHAIWVQPFAVARPALTEIFASAAGDLHAGEIETSIVLHLSQSLVRPGGIDAVPSHPLAYLEFLPLGRLSPSGIWGRPSNATAEKGRQALEAAVSATVDYIERTFDALAQV